VDGQKLGEFEGENFRPPALSAEGGQWGGKRFRNSALAEYQNRKNFRFLN